MKAIVKRIIRDEQGRAMVLAMILLVVGALILTPLLGLMSTGLLAGQVYEKKTDELYAADAGVEDAVWKIQNQVEELPGPPCGGGDPEYWCYSIADVNNKNVDVTITYVNNMTYKVDSIATVVGNGTRVEAYVTGVSKWGDYSGLMDHILLSQGEIDVADKVILEYPEGSEPYEYYPDDWPEVWEFEEFYGEQVAGGIQCSGYTQIDLDGNDCPPGPIYINDEAVDCPSGLEPIYIDGALDVLNSDSSSVNMTLNGTMYATGDTTFGSTSGDFLLDLAGHTIFVSSDTTGNQKALVIGGKCTVKGPGILIAVGDIEFKPKAQIGEEEGGGPIFVLSVTGTTTVQPGGEIYGAIAGGIEVYVQQGEDPTITYPEGGFDEEGLNFLSGIQKLVYQIATWEVNPL